MPKDTTRSKKHKANWLRKGIRLIDEISGSESVVERHQTYLLSVHIRLNRGELIRHPDRCLSYTADKSNKLDDEGYFTCRTRYDRENLVGGIFHALEGMRVGGYRKVVISPHLGYGERGIPGVIPENAKLTIEINVVEELV